MSNVVSQGFTLIELIVAISILAILSIVGLASFVTFSRSQVLNAATSDVFTMLQVARSRAASQVKPSPQCNDKVLEGYSVTLNIATGSYELDAECSGNTTVIQQEKTLPVTVIFDPSSKTSFFFHPVTAGVTIAENTTGYGSIILSASSVGIASTKTITVYTDGRITTN